MAVAQAQEGCRFGSWLCQVGGKDWSSFAAAKKQVSHHLQQKLGLRDARNANCHLECARVRVSVSASHH